MQVKTHRYAALICPTPMCRQALDASTGGEAPPKPGDVTICAYCLTWLTYGEGMTTLQVLTDEEIAGLDDALFKQVLHMSQFAENRKALRDAATESSKDSQSDLKKRHLVDR